MNLGGIFDCDLRSRDYCARKIRCGARRCHCVARRTRFLARRRRCGARRRQGCGNVVWRCRISPAKLRISVHVASSSPCFSEKCSFFCVFGGFGRGFLCARGGFRGCRSVVGDEGLFNGLPDMRAVRFQSVF